MPIEATTIKAMAGPLMADKAISRVAVGMGVEENAGAPGAPGGVEDDAGAAPAGLKRSANSSKAESGCQSPPSARCARVAAFKRPSVIH